MIINATGWASKDVYSDHKYRSALPKTQPLLTKDEESLKFICWNSPKEILNAFDKITKIVSINGCSSRTLETNLTKIKSIKTIFFSHENIKRIPGHEFRNIKERYLRLKSYIKCKISAKTIVSPELMLNIIGYVDFYELRNISLVNKRCYSLVQREYLGLAKKIWYSEDQQKTKPLEYVVSRIHQIERLLDTEFIPRSYDGLFGVNRFMFKTSLIFQKTSLNHVKGVFDWIHTRNLGNHLDQYLSQHNDLESLVTFINLGADPNTLVTSGKITEFWNDVVAKLPINKRKRFLIFLFERGLDINFSVSKRGTILHEMVLSDCFEMAEILLKLKADPNAADDLGLTPLMMVETKQLEIAQLLVDYGADVNKQNNKGDTVLHLTLKNTPTLTLTKKLLEWGVNPNMPNNVQNTALHYASTQNDERIVKVLLKFNANPNAQNHKGKTPLHKAVNNDKPKNVKLLLKAKSNPHLVDYMGNTPLTCSAKLSLDVARALLNSGANLYHKNKQKHFVIQTCTNIETLRFLALRAFNEKNKKISNEASYIT